MHVIYSVVSVRYSFFVHRTAPRWRFVIAESGSAYHAHPERFVSKPPAPPGLPGTSWINPPQEKEAVTQ
jgi:hypothetical protein